MKKEMFAVLLAVGFIFAGVASVNAAATWTLVETATVNQNSPGADGLIGTGDDGTNLCNHDNVVNCIAAGSSTTGAYSFAELTFQMASSCAAGPTGASCTTNTDCGNPLTPCVPCSPNPGLTFFGQHGGGGAKSAGTFTVQACENSGAVVGVAIGTSEVVTNVGGSCMTMQTFNSSSGCAAGAYSTNYDLRLWTNSILPACGTNAGLMPGLSLAGRVYAVPTVGTAVCGYTTTQIGNIMTDAGLGSGDYLTVLCGSGTLPTDLATVCIRGAPWESVVVAKTSANLAAACPAACPDPGCTGAVAEGVE